MGVAVFRAVACIEKRELVYSIKNVQIMTCWVGGTSHPHGVCRQLSCHPCSHWGSETHWGVLIEGAVYTHPHGGNRVPRFITTDPWSKDAQWAGEGWSSVPIHQQAGSECSKRDFALSQQFLEILNETCLLILRDSGTVGAGAGKGPWRSECLLCYSAFLSFDLQGAFTFFWWVECPSPPFDSVCVYLRRWLKRGCPLQ